MQHDNFRTPLCAGVLILGAASAALAQPQSAVSAVQPQRQTAQRVESAAASVAVAAAAITGSGTTGKIPKWTGATTLGNSVMAESAGKIGIGTTTPTEMLTVTGGNVFIATPGKGVKFPNHTVQTTAGLTSVTHNTTLAGSGGAASPLGVAMPLSLGGAVASPNAVLRGDNTSTGSGLYGRHTAASGTAPGVKGDTNSTAVSAVGVLGQINSTSPGTNSAGVRGINNGTNDTGVGVYGSHASGGYGVYGTAPSGFGVYGTSESWNGVQGESNVGAGVNGFSNDGDGVAGQSNTTITAYAGVSGSGPNGIGVLGSGKTGVKGSGGDYGVRGTSAAGTGVSGDSTSGNGVAGSTEGGGSGVSGYCGPSGGDGVKGVANAYYGRGVWGESAAGIGVRASTEDGFAVYATVTDDLGVAGRFDGRVIVNGNLSVVGTIYKGAGGFRIDHPLDPSHKYLSHSFVESPDMKNMYDGVAALDANGAAVVQMPEWFGALNRDFRYQLTCIGGFAPVYIAEKMADNHFKIAGGQTGMEVSWQVTGIRQDAYANAHRLQVEVDKTGTERGSYLHPELFGQPAAKGIAWAQQPQTREPLPAQPERPLALPRP